MEKKRKTIKVTRLREERLKRGYTLDDVVEKTGIHRTTLKDYELLLHTPGIKAYRKLEKFYGASPEVDLLEVVEIDGENVFHSIKSL